jgi:hypothetical protein
MASRGAPWGVSPTGMETDARRPGLPPADPPIRALGQRSGRPPAGTARDTVPPSLHARDPALEIDGIRGGDLHGARRLIQA